MLDELDGDGEGEGEGEGECLRQPRMAKRGNEQGRGEAEAVEVEGRLHLRKVTASVRNDRPAASISEVK